MDEDEPIAAWRTGNKGAYWLNPFRLPRGTVADLRRHLAGRVNEYVDAAVRAVAIQRESAGTPRPTARELRVLLRDAARGRAPNPATVPLLEAALIVDLHVDPDHATPTEVMAAAAIALQEMPPVRRGRPRRPKDAGRDVLEESLMDAFAQITGRPRTCAAAAECAEIVLRAAGIGDREAEVESRQRAARRRRGHP